MGIAKKIVLVVAVCVLIISAVVALDSLNVATALGLDTSAFQWDLLSIVIGNVVVIAIFIITYILIESNNIKRQKNQEKSAKIILEGIYNQCKSTISWLDDSNVRNSTASKLNGNLPLYEEPTVKRCQNAPFEYEQYVFEASNNGILSEDEFTTFLQIREHYKKYIALRLTFFDAETYNNGLPIEEQMKALIKTKRQELLQMIDRQLGER